LGQGALKHFPGCRFDIRNMKNREKLIRETPVLYESFKDLHYKGGFVRLVQAVLGARRTQVPFVRFL
jgi:hypothetical protein